MLYRVVTRETCFKPATGRYYIGGET